MARFLPLHNAVDVAAQLRVGFAGAHVAVEVVLHLGEEAGADLAVGGEPDAAACSAEWLGDGGNDADFALAIGEAEAAGGLRGIAWGELDEWQDAANALDDFGDRYDDFGRPEAAFLERHEFDKPDHDGFTAGEVGEAFDLVVVEAAEQDAVNLERSEAGFAGGAHAAQNGVEAAWDAGDALESGRVHRVHADSDAMEAGGAQRDGERLEQVAVGGESEIERVAGLGAQAGEFLNHLDEASAQQRLAAGEADLGDAEGDKKPDEPQILIDGELGILGPDFSCPAIDTLIVAAVGDGDAQVVNHPAMAICQAGRRGYRIGDWGKYGHRQTSVYSERGESG